MNRAIVSRPFTLVPTLAALLIAGCEAPPRGHAPAEAITFESGAGAAARVKRTALAGGAEALHGETEIALGASARRCVIEDVTLDAAGRLVRAAIAVADECGAGAVRDGVVLDAERGTVSGPGVPEWQAESGAPWIYAPEILPGRTVTTPVSAWVARRAAETAPSLMLVQLGRRAAWKVPREQVVVPTEVGATVVLGDDGADVGASFVERVHLGEYGVTLVRGARSCPAI